MPRTDERPSERAMRLAERMRRECSEWMDTAEARAVSNSEEELEAAVTAFAAGWMKGLTAR